MVRLHRNLILVLILSVPFIYPLSAQEADPAPVDGALPTEEVVPAEEGGAVDGALPTDEVVPAEEEGAIDGALPTDESVPAEEEGAIDETAPANEAVPGEGGEGSDEAGFLPRQPQEERTDSPLDRQLQNNLPLEQFTNSQGEVFDLKTFTNYNIYFLEDITIKDLEEEETGELEVTPFADETLRELLIALVEEDQEVIIRRLAEQIDPIYAEESDLTFLKEEVLKILNPQPAPERPELVDVPLSTDLPVEGVILQSADVVDVFDVTVDGETERMIHLYGRVSVNIDTLTIGADFIRINATRQESYIRGNVSLDTGENFFSGESAIWDIEAGQGYIFDSTGTLDDQYIEGSLISINSRQYISMENGWMTFSENPDPYYRFSTVKFDSYEGERWIVQNSLVEVGDHPFLWIPYYINYPLSTGLELRFGETRREGFYALTRYGFPIPVLGVLVVNLNVYEKLGIYNSYENENSTERLTYDFLFIGALYTFNENSQTDPSLAYTHHSGDYLETSSRFRRKVAYNQRLDLIDEENTLVQSSIDFSLTNVNDPLLTDTFPLGLSHLDWQKIIQRHDRDEALYNPSVSDSNAYNIDYSLSAPSTAVASRFDWNYGVYDDPALREGTIDDRYTIYLSNISLPQVNISHDGALDPINSEGDRAFFLNLGYDIGFSYNGNTNFKDGQELDEGLDTTDTVEPYGLVNEEYSLALDFSLNRPITINVNENSLVKFDRADWFTWSVTPNFSIGYDRDWTGVDYSASENQESDRADNVLRYGVSTGLDFFKTKKLFFDQDNSLSFTINQTNTTFRLPAGEVFSGTADVERREEAINYSLSTSHSFNFPSTTRSGLWSEATDYRNMLPIFIFNVGYSESAFTTEENIEQDRKFEFDRYNSRTLTSSLGTTQRGYGLFYIPKLDYIFNHNISLSYDLIPDEDEDGEYIPRSENPDFWRQDRFNNFGGAFSVNFIYDYFRENLINLNNQLSYDIYDQNEEEINSELILYGMNFEFGYAAPQDKRFFITLESINFGFNWDYYFQEEDYLNDSMGLSFSVMLDLVERYQLRFELQSFNTEAYRYFPEKANALGREPVNFLRDLGNSSGFAGRDNQVAGLFKLSGFNVSLYHDIGDWFMSLNYSFIPLSYTDDSLRGYYLEHRIDFQVNLKPERDPRGPIAAENNPYFRRIEEDFGSDIFDVTSLANDSDTDDN